MTPTNKKTFTFVLPDDLKVALQRIRARDGIAEAEQIRRGIQMWIKSKGVRVKSERPRVSDRKRS